MAGGVSDERVRSDRSHCARPRNDAHHGSRGAKEKRRKRNSYPERKYHKLVVGETSLVDVKNQGT